MTKEIKRKFKGDAVSYQKTRPDYPSELFAALIHFWNQASEVKEPIIADIGCGTGIATRGIYDALHQQCKVFGIEPDFKMLKQAKEATSIEENIIYIAGTAEKLSFRNKSVDIVLVAQAMQYFDRPLFYRESKRILKQGGIIASIENNRDWKSSPFLEKYEEFLEKNTYDKNIGSYSRGYRSFPFIEEFNNYFHDATEKNFRWSKEMSPNDFLEMIKSTTSAQRAIANIGQKNVEQQILELIHSHVNNKGLLDIPYISKAYLARN